MHFYELGFLGRIYSPKNVDGSFLWVGGSNDFQFYPYREFETFVLLHAIIHNNKKLKWPLLL